MRKYEIYFVDCNGYGGTMKVTNCRDIYEAKKRLANYVRVWNLLPITDLSIKEI